MIKSFDISNSSNQVQYFAFEDAVNIACVYKKKAILTFVHKNSVG